MLDKNDRHFAFTTIHTKKPVLALDMLIFAYNMAVQDDLMMKTE